MKKADTAGINKLINYVTNNPTVTSEEMLRKAIELGYEPGDLIDKALGSVKYEKSGANLSKNLEDILNDVYQNDPTPGDRYVVDPMETRYPKSKEFAKNLRGLLGYQTNVDTGKSRKKPKEVVVRNMWDDLGKLQGISSAGHELKHSVDDLIRPGFYPKTDDSFKPGHHYGDIYETSELVREVKDLPENDKVTKEIKKQSKKLNLKAPSPFRRLLSILGPVGASIAAGYSLKSGDAMGAGLNLASAIDPTGISDTALEVKNRLAIKDPEEIEKLMLEDKYSAMPGGPSPSDIMLDQLKNYKKKK
jgi:hypothetical protein